MELHLSAEQQAFIREGIESGRLEKPEDAFEQAMSLWEERERRRLEILAAVQAADASLERGEGRTVTSREQMIQLGQAVKLRGIERLAAEPKQR
jgi:Arc/MetJ-type ribon-helix-helix transcriptional regulator